LKPDLVILDVTMPVLNGLDTAREIRIAAPGTKILLLSMHDSQQLEREAKAVGVDALASKTAAGTQLIRIIEHIDRTPHTRFSARLPGRGIFSHSEVNVPRPDSIWIV
jgi:DNA-binding NarL/FixJ family response regulator